MMYNVADVNMFRRWFENKFQRRIPSREVRPADAGPSPAVRRQKRRAAGASAWRREV